jgi:hypothetical protein
MVGANLLIKKARKRDELRLAMNYIRVILGLISFPNWLPQRRD